MKTLMNLSPRDPVIVITTTPIELMLKPEPDVANTKLLKKLVRVHPRIRMHARPPLPERRATIASLPYIIPRGVSVSYESSLGFHFSSYFDR
jgi:hypothetical protein